MVPVTTTIFCIITLLVSLVLPVVFLIVYAAKHKKQGFWSAWLLGAVGFVIPQLCIRLPILTALQKLDWFLRFSRNNLFAYAFSMAFSAGLFELAGRFAVAKGLRKNLTCRRALAAGLGHGGIEAMMLIGMSYINNLVYIFMINNGTFDAMLAQSAAAGVDTAPLLYYQDALLHTASAMFLLAGLERILTMTAHAAMSMLVCYGVAHRKTLPCVLVCLAIHTFIDLTAGLSLLSGTVLSQTVVYTIIYLILTVVAVFSLYIIRTLRSRWNAAAAA